MHNQTPLVMMMVVALAVLGLAAMLLMPTPVEVNAMHVHQGPFTEYIEDEGYTHLRDPHTVSAPISGFLHRVTREPGDRVVAGDALFELESLPTPALDARAREQAAEAIAAAQSRLEAAEAELEARETERALAETEFGRIQRLYERGGIAAEERDRRQSRHDAARAAAHAAQHTVDVARFELESARAVLEVADGERAALDQPTLSVRSPIDGTITRRHRCCEGPVLSGEPVIEIGDLNTLEVRVDLLSRDAVRIKQGMRVVISQWGQDEPLEGQVRRVEPAGYTRVSALGVDEQRVPVRVSITSPREDWAALGDAYRVEARFILWEGDDVTQVPVSALFRETDQWAVFVVRDGRAQLRLVSTGRRSGLWTQISDGLEPGDMIITHPGDRVEDGVRVDVDLRRAYGPQSRGTHATPLQVEH